MVLQDPWLCAPRSPEVCLFVTCTLSIIYIPQHFQVFFCPKGERFLLAGPGVSKQDFPVKIGVFDQFITWITGYILAENKPTLGKTDCPLILLTA
jgi:hypothetical protein